MGYLCKLCIVTFGVLFSRELARADGNCVVTPVHGINDNTAWAVAKVSRSFH